MKKTRLYLVAIVVMLPLMAMAGKAKVLKIDFKNPIAERNVGSSSFDIMSLVQGTPGSVTLLSYINAIDAAAEDKNISIVEAMRMIYSSDTYKQLENEATKMWHLGPVALYQSMNG